MKDTTRAAFAAANAVDAAITVASYATTLHRATPDDWKLVDEAYWLLRAAQETAQKTADALDPEEALEDDTMKRQFASSPASKRLRMRHLQFSDTERLSSCAYDARMVSISSPSPLME